MYTPELARFMQTDPIGYYDAMNLYQYAFNSPTNYLDPWGLSSKESTKEGLKIKLLRKLLDALEYRPAVGVYGGGELVWADSESPYSADLDDVSLDIGVNIMVFGGTELDAGAYGYWVRQKEDAEVAKGLSGGLSGGGVLAIGRGQWKGNFDNYKLVPVIFGVSYFQSPDKNWRGITFGYGPGAGVAKTRTWYDGWDTGLE